MESEGMYRPKILNATINFRAIKRLCHVNDLELFITKLTPFITG